MEKFYSKRQEYENTSAETRRLVNEKLDSLVADVNIANLYISENYSKNPEETYRYALGAVEYLNDQWGDEENIFLVSGKIDVPYVQYDLKSINITHQSKEVFTALCTTGFELIPPDEEAMADPKIKLAFLLKSSELNLPYMKGDVSFFAYANPNEISMDYIRPAGESIVSSDLGEVDQALQQAHAILNLHLNSDNSNFYKQSAKKQEEFIGSVIDSIESVMPAIGTYDVLVLSQAEAKDVYFKTNDNRLVALKSQLGSPLLVSGKVVGITMLDTVLQGSAKHYKSPEDFTCGVKEPCFVVSPVPGLINGELYDGNDLMIPISQIADKLELY